MDELTLGDKTYISSKRAAEITGYAKDYVGQLCREGHVEAKMVGRSWYVLESSIRAHRFGAPATAAPEQASVEPEPEALSTWEAPRYVAEIPKSIPAVMERPVVMPQIDHEAASAAMADMQAAWKEWFELKQEATLPAPDEEVLLETPEIMDARAEESYVEDRWIAESPIESVSEATRTAGGHESDEEVSIPFNKVEEAPVAAYEPAPEMNPQAEEGEVRVPIRTIRTPRPVARPEPVRAVRREHIVASGTRSGNLVTVAGLVVVAIIAIAVGMINTGHADRYVGSNAILRYLGGTSIVNKQ